MDTIYNPENTMMIKEARSRGASVVTGLDMFIRQAAGQFRVFNGVEPPIDLMRQVAKNALTPITVRQTVSPENELTAPEVQAAPAQRHGDAG